MVPVYLKSCLNLINQRNYGTRSSHPNFVQISHSRTKAFSFTFFRYFIDEWNKLNSEILNTESSTKFKDSILSFIKTRKLGFAAHYVVGFELFTRLRFGFSHLNEHKFRDNFKDKVNPICLVALNRINKTLSLALPRLYCWKIKTP